LGIGYWRLGIGDCLPVGRWSGWGLVPPQGFPPGPRPVCSSAERVSDWVLGIGDWVLGIGARCV